MTFIIFKSSDALKKKLCDLLKTYIIIITNVDEDRGKLEPSYVADIKWYRHFGQQFRNSLKS